MSRPKSAAGPLTTLLELSIDPTRNFAKEYAAHGYAGVAAYMEGSRAIPFVPYQHDGEEARALILWIAKQPWSDGRVAMVGEGYSGLHRLGGGRASAGGAQGYRDVRAHRAGDRYAHGRGHIRELGVSLVVASDQHGSLARCELRG